MSTNPNILVNIRSDKNFVPSALRSTIPILTVLPGWIVKHEEVTLVPGCSIVTNKGRLKTGKDIFNARVKQTISLFERNTSLMFLAIPFRCIITPMTIVKIFTPWISKKDKPFSRGKLLGLKDDVRVIFNE